MMEITSVKFEMMEITSVKFQMMKITSVKFKMEITYSYWTSATPETEASETKYFNSNIILHVRKLLGYNNK